MLLNICERLQISSTYLCCTAKCLSKNPALCCSIRCNKCKPVWRMFWGVFLPSCRLVPHSRIECSLPGDVTVCRHISLSCLCIFNTECRRHTILFTTWNRLNVTQKHLQTYRQTDRSRVQCYYHLLPPNICCRRKHSHANEEVLNKQEVRPL